MPFCHFPVYGIGTSECVEKLIPGVKMCLNDTTERTTTTGTLAFAELSPLDPPVQKNTAGLKEANAGLPDSFNYWCFKWFLGATRRWRSAAPAISMSTFSAFAHFYQGIEKSFWGDAMTDKQPASYLTLFQPVWTSRSLFYHQPTLDKKLYKRFKGWFLQWWRDPTQLSGRMCTLHQYLTGWCSVWKQLKPFLLAIHVM